MPKAVGVWDRVKQAHEVLEKLHPGLFDLDTPKPFKVGIATDIATMYSDLPYRIIRTMFAWLACRRAYLIVCTEGAMRYGLDGPSGEVTSSEAAYASELFKLRDATSWDKWADKTAKAA